MVSSASPSRRRPWAVSSRSSRDGVAGWPGPRRDRASAVVVAMGVQAASVSSVALSGSTFSGVVMALRGFEMNPTRAAITSSV